MNRLPVAERTAIVRMLIEGNTLRSSSRLADVSLNTVTKLLVEIGAACERFHDEHIRNVRVRRLRVREIWCFTGARANNAMREKNVEGWDLWTWTGFDTDSKLFLGYLVGGRDSEWAKAFMQECAGRIKGSIRIAVEGPHVYLEALDDGFGAEIDSELLPKIYGAPTAADMRRYGPARKIQNHVAALAIHAVCHNFVRMHKALRITPAMAAGLSNRVWSLEDIVLMADSYKLKKRGPYREGNSV